MTWHAHLIIGSCVVAAVVALVAIFRRDKKITAEQASQIKASLEKKIQADLQAEEEEAFALERNKKQAQLDLRALAAREQAVVMPFVGQPKKEQEQEAEKALKRWQAEKLQCNLFVGLVALWFVLAVSIPAYGAKLNTTQRLTKALNECVYSKKRARIEHAKKVADVLARCHRQSKQKLNTIRQLQQELLVLRSAKCASNTPFIVGASVAGTVAVVAVGVAILAVINPGLFGRGAK